MIKSQSSKIGLELHGRLLILPFHGYARLLGMLLEKLGYHNVQLSGRTDWKGRNRAGGFDLIATLPGGIAPRQVVIQVKQFDQRGRIFQRQIDELRGVALRHRASEAILITTGPVSPSIKSQELEESALPVRLIGKDVLLALLIEHQVGIRRDGVLDEALLDRLTREASGNSRTDCPGRPDLLLQVELIAIPKTGRHSAPKHQTTIRKVTMSATT